MEIQYLGHSAVILKGENFKAIIDPFISGNPNCSLDVEELNDITHIFVTHGHGDHLGDTIKIAKKCNSLVVCNFEIGNYLEKFKLNVHTMHIGGKFIFDFGKVKMLNAVHGSGIIDGENIIYGGNPCGFLIEIEGKKVYHAGDTGLTLDMTLLKDEEIDIAFIPIGGNYTMDISDAVKAVDFIKPKAVIPIHYDTFPVIKADPLVFKERITDSKVIILSANDVLQF